MARRKLLLIVLMILASIIFCINTLAQELPEPTSPPITYEVQIAWGTKTNLIWLDIVPLSQTVVSGVVGEHNYYGHTGVSNWEFTALDSTASVPLKCLVDIDVIQPNNKLFDYYRIRVKGKIGYNSNFIFSEYSEASYWVMVINLTKPNRPSNK